MTRPTWDGYVAAFHRDEAGITEELLGRTTDAGGSGPYAWAAEAIGDPRTIVLDVAGGSGPLADHIGTGGQACARWAGIDLAEAELAVARSAGRTPLIRGSATDLPVGDAALSSVVCAMSLQVIEPLDPAIAELARVLVPGGRVVLLLPASSPLGLRDAWTYLRLQIALRAVIRYPNGPALSPRRLPGHVGRHRLVVRSDERRRFLLPLPDHEAADLLVRSLYLPGTGADLRAHGRAVVAARIGGGIGIPLRRVVLERSRTLGPAAA